jgi:membrane protease YdiL (CAAX protease family)
MAARGRHRAGHLVEPVTLPDPDRSFVSIAVVFYLGLTALAWGISLLLGPLVPLVSTWRWETVGRDLGLGIGMAAAIVAVTWFCGRRFAWSRDLEGEFARLLGPLDSADIFTVALFSGVAEEVFFRGALQPHVGYVSASLLFGLFHIGPSRAFVGWTVFALAIGFLFGGIVALTGSLLPVIVAHFGVNFVNLHRITRRGAPDGGREGARDPHESSARRH